MAFLALHCVVVRRQRGDRGRNVLGARLPQRSGRNRGLKNAFPLAKTRNVRHRTYMHVLHDQLVGYHVLVLSSHSNAQLGGMAGRRDGILRHLVVIVDKEYMRQASLKLNLTYRRYCSAEPRFGSRLSVQQQTR